MQERSYPFLKCRMAGRTVRGTNAITQIGLLVPSFESLTYWKKRFEQLDVKHGEITTYAGREALPFEDAEGLRMILLNNNGEEIPEFWSALGRFGCGARASNFRDGNYRK